MTEKHVVVGAGPVGRAAAELLARQGKQVLLLSRRGTGVEHPGVQAVAADAADAKGLLDVSAGAAVLYNCLNPEYHRWTKDWPPLAASLLAAAEQHGAVLATVSNLYGYGPVNVPMTPDLPLLGAGSKAQVRVHMWRQALAAHQAGRVRITEIRASDYVGVGASSHLGDQVVPRLLAGKRPQFVVPLNQKHSFSYIPDVAATLLAAAAQPSAWGRAWHVPSPAPISLRTALTQLATLAGVTDMKPQVLAPLVQRGLGLFIPLFRELAEVRYQFERPYILNSEATTAEFGITATEWPTILTDIIAGYRKSNSGS